MTASMIARWLLYQAAVRLFCTSSVTLATSRRCTGAPLWYATTILLELRGVVEVAGGLDRDGLLGAPHDAGRQIHVLRVDRRGDLIDADARATRAPAD